MVAKRYFLKKGAIFEIDSERDYWMGVIYLTTNVKLKIK